MLAKSHEPGFLGARSCAWTAAAIDTVDLLAGGRDVLFLVEGDASTYSTF